MFCYTNIPNICTHLSSMLMSIEMLYFMQNQAELYIAGLIVKSLIVSLFSVEKASQPLK